MMRVKARADVEGRRMQAEVGCFTPQASVGFRQDRPLQV